MRVLEVLIIAALLVPFPITVTGVSSGWLLIGVDLAYAEKGRGRGGDDDLDDADDVDDDRSGRRGGDDDDDIDDVDVDVDVEVDDGSDDDLNELPNRLEDTRDDGVRTNTTSNSNRSISGNADGNRPPANLHLMYPNGWDERIFDGRYILVDPEGRKVADRVAKHDDLARMRAAAGLD